MKEKCKNCARPSKACISYLMTLSTKEMLEWCLMWKDRFGWSNSAFAEKSNVPKGTVDRTMRIAKGTDDGAGANMATIRPYICAITGCTMEELESCDSLHHVSSIELMEKAEAAEKENELLKLKLHKADEKYKADIQELKADYKAEMDFLKHQLEHEQETSESRKKAFYTVAICLGFTLSIIIVALVIDRLNPDIGFFWVDRMSAAFNGNAQNTLHEVTDWGITNL